MGASLGSFINVLIHRLPLKQSIVKPSSHCANCGYSIPPYYNVPIISYIILKGKCSKCGDKIHWHHLLVEVITPILLIMIFFRYGLTSLFTLKYAILICFLIPIFFIDAFHKLILHVTTFPLLIIGLLFSLVQGNDISALNSFVTGLGVILILSLTAWIFSALKKQDGLGGGDIWLLGALGTNFGALVLPWIILLSCVFALLYYIIYVRKKDNAFVFGPFIVIATILWILGLSDIVLPYINI